MEWMSHGLLGDWMRIAVRVKSLISCAILLLGCIANGCGGNCNAELPALSGPPVLLQMIRDDAVHAELKLTDQQRTRILSALREVDGPWFRSRNLESEARELEIRKITRQLEQRLHPILDAVQQQRLLQLQYQALGTRMLLRDDVASMLKLSKTQRESLKSTFQATDRAIVQLPRSDAEAEQSERIRQVKQRELDSVAEQLTADQQRRLGDLAGPDFDFSSVRRTYPFAPELTLDGVTWIQGGPLSLADLKGKVVAVHFYAFQCINCQRNLPHYKVWWEDYADRGLVVIGLQTPETAAERHLEQVRAAAKREAIKYPVLLDLESANWKNWSNTMWPTVYLIDRQGFLRRWWQGELNWRGGDGEQQMRRTIEQLLAEPLLAE